MPDRLSARRLLRMLDLTSLGEDDPPARIAALCEAAEPRHGSVAAVCVYPEHVQACRARLAGGPVRVATVVNFPDGAANPDRAARECRRALAVGAQEVDLVFPWRALQAGDAAVGGRVVSACRAVLPEGIPLKVILESGMLDPMQLRAASMLALQAGADFLKTSTGKAAAGASPEAVQAMLAAIGDSGRACGLKVSGGVRTFADAMAYLQLVESMMGEGWATPARFRIGASSLLDDLLRVLEGDADAGHAAGGMAY